MLTLRDSLYTESILVVGLFVRPSILDGWLWSAPHLEERTSDQKSIQRWGFGTEKYPTDDSDLLIVALSLRRRSD